MTEVLEAQQPQKGLKQALQRLRNRKARKGLTLVELAIVLLVLGVIIGIVYANLDTGAVDNAKITMFPAQAAQLGLLPARQCAGVVVLWHPARDPGDASSCHSCSWLDDCSQGLPGCQ